MNRILFYSLAALYSFCTYAQVGINTNDPKGVLHIDGKNDGSLTPASVANDIIVTSDGNMGVGVIAPTAKLHIVAPTGSYGLAIQDGNQGEGNIFVSDANGNGSWIVSDVSQFSTVPYEESSKQTFTGSSYTYETNLQISFPRFGTYSVSIASRAFITRPSNTPPILFGYLAPPALSTVYFPGSVQTRGLYIMTTTFQYQIYINQNIEINASTGLTAKLYLTASGFSNSTNSGQIYAIWGDNSTLCGGTYIRVK